MKPWAIAASVALLAALGACRAKEHRIEKRVDDVRVTLIAPRYPLVRGSNRLAVLVEDARGAGLGDARVEVRYGLPAMPGMGAVEYEAETSVDGRARSFVLDAHTSASWDVGVTVLRPNQAPVRAVFTVDVS